ncbi:9388_t:CDS:2 [Gigaspora margarita]|uniref:9388_t:CDS:1 n=1 Tax=Gigaspora margarita TaxID=4874 RepID=A0ABM8VWI6_GIGMA|nr:9388_t:CDS:2 [Gigaspora margarita]
MDLDSRAFSKLIDAWNTHGGSEDYIRILDAIGPLTKRHDHKIPEMWCSRIRDPFRKILEENYSRRILSKNEYIEIYRKLYENDKVHGYPTNYIYCSRCISGNSISNEHARRKEILKSIDRREFQIWQYKQYILEEETKIKRLQLELLSQSTLHSEKDKLASVSYDHDANFTGSYENYAQSKAKDTMPSALNFEPAYIPVTSGNQEMIWEAVRNDGVPDRKKFLGIPSHGQIKINPITQEEYALNLDNFINRFKKNSKYPIKNYNLDKMAIAYKEYIYFDFNGWIEQKKYQLSQRLDKEAHDLVKKILEQQGYRGDYSAQWGFQIVYLPWRYMIESLQNPEKYHQKFNGY